jgi:hypothetical protein
MKEQPRLTARLLLIDPMPVSSWHHSVIVAITTIIV